MSMYFAYTLFVVDPKGRLTSELRLLIEKLKDDEWKIVEQTPHCVIMASFGNYLVQHLPRFQDNPEVLLAISGTNDSSPDNHILKAAYLDDFISGSFNYDGTHCESDAIPSQQNQSNTA